MIDTDGNRDGQWRLESIIEATHAGTWEWNVQTGETAFNEIWAQIIGYTLEELTPVSIETWERFTDPADFIRSAELLERYFSGELPYYDCECRMKHKNGQWVWIHDRGRVITRSDDGKPLLMFGTHTDITERKQKEAYNEMGRKILQILNEPEDLHDSIKRVIGVFKTGTGSDAVGIRLQDGEDYPYYAQEGFPEDFLITENSLVARDAQGGIYRTKDDDACLECTCGMVIYGEPLKRANPLLTPGGSFRTNDAFPILEIPPGEDPRFNPRNRCIHYGYASVALVPIRNEERIVGLIQLNDRRKECFTLATIEILEGIASHIGSALMRKRSEQKLKRALEENRNLLRELQHRAKNSFNMISGMISFATSAGVSADAEAALEEFGSRVRSVSELYSLLYSSDSFSELRLDDYCARVAAPLLGLSNNISLRTELEDIIVPAKEAAPIGLIITELITNAVKYAFPGERQGIITLTLRKTAAKGILEVNDDGIGLPDGFELATSKGMGLNLIQGLVGQIDGGFRMESSPKGTRCIVEFTLENKSGVVP